MLSREVIYPGFDDLHYFFRFDPMEYEHGAVHSALDSLL